MSVVKINALTVEPGMGAVLEERFAARSGTVQQYEGFEHFELLRPVEGSEQYLVYTRWRSEEDYQRWLKDSGRVHHRPESGGERPKPAASQSTLWGFEVVQQVDPQR